MLPVKYYFHQFYMSISVEVF